MSEPAATATAEIYCQACGYDLHGANLAGGPGREGRCPECGRTFSPHIPSSFRRRPPGVRRRAVIRWAWRAALLLLVVGAILGWWWTRLHEEWKREQPALAKIRGLRSTPVPIEHGWEWFGPRWEAGPLGGEGLERWCGPAGFALRRVFALELPDLTNDADLTSVRQFAYLEKLLLKKTKITDAGLAHLRELRRLQFLDLSETSITDAGLVHLEKLTRLQWLDLTRTKVTPAGAGRLKAALPGCTIVGP